MWTTKAGAWGDKPLTGSRKELKGSMSRPRPSEIAPIHRDQRPKPQPFGDRDDGSVHEPQEMVGAEEHHARCLLG